jgi:hypothetical protein
VNRDEDNTACAVFGEKFFQEHPESWRLIMSQPDWTRRKVVCEDCGHEHDCEAHR